MTEKQARDMAEAYQSAASHLEQNWTDDPGERAAGKILANKFFDQWSAWLDRADKIRDRKAKK